MKILPFFVRKVETKKNSKKQTEEIKETEKVENETTKKVSTKKK